MTTPSAVSIGALHQLKSFNYPDPKYGIEVETESEVDALPIINTEWWTSKPDTSLRHNGMEYVSAKPFTDANVEDQLKYLLTRLNKKKILHDSPRTSTHLHYNMMDYSPCQVWVAAVAYWMVENIMFKYCGEDREGNLFCLRLKDASGVITTAIRDVTASAVSGGKYAVTPFSSFHRNDNVRYGGLNLNSLPKFGTLELRGMRGVYDVETIHTWTKLTDRLFTNAIAKYKTPAALVLDYTKNGATKFVEGLFGDMVEVLARVCPSDTWKKLIDTNMNYVIPLVVQGKWSALDECAAKIIEERKNNPKLDGNQPMTLAQLRAIARGPIVGQRHRVNIIDDVVPQVDDDL